jgi:hypothetical protein
MGRRTRSKQHSCAAREKLTPTAGAGRHAASPSPAPSTGEFGYDYLGRSRLIRIASLVLEACCQPHHHSRFPGEDRIAEIFISSVNPAGSPLEALARDSAVTVSLALQYGVPLEVLRAALTRDHDGGPATLLGAAINRLSRP